MRVAVTGASGFIGRAAAHHLTEAGHDVVAARRSSRDGETNPLRWDPATGFEPASALSGFDAVLHLAGENIASRRWTSARKSEIRSSREQGTRRVVEALERASPRPSVLLCASAVGFYGARGSEALTERASPGQGFLAEVAQVWEREAERATALGVRVVQLRFGMILDHEGGALAKLLLPFDLGLGGQLGDGQQWMSWIHRDDAVSVIRMLLETPEAAGAVNVCAPHPVTNHDFTRALGRALHRPAWIPLPKFAVKAALGEMAEALLLSGQKVVPERLQALEFDFRYPTLEQALAAIVAARENRSS